ncbi:MAG: EpsG family protein, partial [Spirochaetia bacterium]|nr:EpsG family protein [Spirochaetia bacterium]
ALALGYCIVSRLSGYQVDMFAYAGEMHSSQYGIYIIKEPVYWVGSRILFKLVQSELFVFLAYDILIILLLFNALKDKVEPVFGLLFFMSFPYLLGIENVYRQVIGLSFLLLALRFSENRQNVKAIFIFFLAILSHNVYAIFFPIVVFLWQKKLSIGSRAFIILFIASIVATLIFLIQTGVITVIGKKSSSNTGITLDYLHITLVFCIVIFLSILSGKTKEHFGQILIMGGYGLGLLISMGLMFGTGGYLERISMIFEVSLFAVFIINGSYQQVDKWSRFLFTFVFFIVMVLPVLTFPATLEFLIGSNPIN